MSEQLRDEVLRAVDKGLRVAFYPESHSFLLVVVEKVVDGGLHSASRAVRHVEPRLGPGGTIDPLAYSLRVVTNELEREIGE